MKTYSKFYLFLYMTMYIKKCQQFYIPEYTIYFEQNILILFRFVIKTFHKYIFILQSIILHVVHHKFSHELDK